MQIGNARSMPGMRRRAEHRLAGAHPVLVALDGVDLAVVGDVAVRVGQRPRRERVGGEAAVHEQQGALEALVVEVGKNAASCGVVSIPLYTSVRDDSDGKYVASSASSSCSIRLRATNVLRSRSMPVAPPGSVTTS